MCVRRCCYAFQECNGPMFCPVIGKDVLGMKPKTLQKRAQNCPEKGKPLTMADYGLDRQAIRRLVKGGKELV